MKMNETGSALTSAETKGVYKSVLQLLILVVGWGLGNDVQQACHCPLIESGKDVETLGVTR